MSTTHKAATDSNIDHHLNILIMWVCNDHITWNVTHVGKKIIEI